MREKGKVDFEQKRKLFEYKLSMTNSKLEEQVAKDGTDFFLKKLENMKKLRKQKFLLEKILYKDTNKQKSISERMRMEHEGIGKGILADMELTTLDQDFLETNTVQLSDFNTKGSKNIHEKVK